MEWELSETIELLINYPTFYFMLNGFFRFFTSVNNLIHTRIVRLFLWYSWFIYIFLFIEVLCLHIMTSFFIFFSRLYINWLLFRVFETNPWILKRFRFVAQNTNLERISKWTIDAFMYLYIRWILILISMIILGFLT